MTLPVARHLASLGVDVITGYHPNGVQGHAYMGKTLVLFSLGHILSSDSLVSYCWNKVSTHNNNNILSRSVTAKCSDMIFGILPIQGLFGLMSVFWYKLGDTNTIYIGLKY